MLWRRIHAAYGSTGTLDKTREPVLASAVVRRACGDLASVPDTASRGRVAGTAALWWFVFRHAPEVAVANGSTAAALPSYIEVLITRRRGELTHGLSKLAAGNYD